MNGLLKGDRKEEKRGSSLKKTSFEAILYSLKRRADFCGRGEWRRRRSTVFVKLSSSRLYLDIGSELMEA